VIRRVLLQLSEFLATEIEKEIYRVPERVAQTVMPSTAIPLHQRSIKLDAVVHDVRHHLFYDPRCPTDLPTSNNNGSPTRSFSRP
jgi:hypothetical protein